MKKILIYLFAAVLFLGTMCSCYDDKGNYDYSELTEITVDGVPGSLKCLALVDSLKFNPEIYPASSDYDYCWAVTSEGQVGVLRELDTIALTKELNWLVNLQPDHYLLYFIATDKKTGIASISETKMEVSTALSTGWYVLRSQDGYSDLDLFGPHGKAENIIAQNNNGYKLKGEASAVCHADKYWIPVPGRPFPKRINAFMACSEGDIISMHLSNGKIIRTSEDIWYGAPDKIHCQSIMADWGDFFFINDGQLYSIYGMSPNSGRFGEAKSGTYHLSDSYVFFMKCPLLFDELSSSFCTADTYGNALVNFEDGGEISVNNMNVDLLFMGPAANNQAWALVKAKGKDEYSLLKMKAVFSWGETGNPIISSDKLDNSLNIVSADHWASNIVNNIIYYSKGSKIYSCNIEGGFAERFQQNLPEGEEVTFMRHMKFSPWGKPEAHFEHLCVATFDGENYRIYLYNLQAGNLQADPKVLSGKGKVGAIVYMDNDSSTPLN